MSWWTLVKTSEPAINWTKITITKEDLMSIASGIEEYWFNPYNPFENFLELYIETRTYRGSGELPEGTGCIAYVDDIVIHTSTSTCGVVLSATIEDNRKTWTADQFNTDGMFILTSGDVKGYSCTILDTFENYIQVPTTFANIINNIRGYDPGYGNYEDFETGATTWTKDPYSEGYVDFESTGPGGETPSPHSGTYCCKIFQGPE